MTPKSYKEARASIHRGCRMAANHGWRNAKPSQTGLLDRHPSVLSSSKYPIMGTRWTYPKKTDDNGTFTQYRGHLIAKGLSQVLGVDYFESFSPVASFVTIHTLLVFQVLTDLPMFEVIKWSKLHELSWTRQRVRLTTDRIFSTEKTCYDSSRIV